MTRTRPTASVAALLLALATGATGCGAIVENIGEEVAEQVVEAESGEEVEIDFDADDEGGTFSIETEDGKIEFDADDDGGTITLDDQEGEEGVLAFGDEAEVPSCVTDRLSLPSDLEPQSVMSGDGFCLFTAVVTSGESVEELADRYEAEIAAAGYTDNTARSSFESNGSAQVSVSGTDAEGGNLAVMIAEQQDYSFADGSVGDAIVLNVTVG